MTYNESVKRAEEVADYVFDGLLPEIVRESQAPVKRMACLVVSAAMSSQADCSSQVKHLSMPHSNWDAALVSGWAMQSALDLEDIIKRFERGVNIETLGREFHPEQVPAPFALVQCKGDLIRNLAALLKLHDGEVSYYDYTKNEELLLVCLVSTTVWR